MASKQEIFERRKKIVAALQEKKQLSVEELMEISGAKKRTLMDDIAELRMQGMEIKVGNSLVSLMKETKLATIEHSNEKIMRQVQILMLFGSDNYLTEEELTKRCKEKLDFDRLYCEKEAYEVELEKSLIEDNFRKLFETDMKSLLEKKILEYDGHVYKRTFETPVCYKMSEEEIYDFLCKIAIGRHGEAYATVLERIEEKLNNDIVCKLGEKSNFTDKMYTFERKRNLDLEKGMSLIKRVSYKTNVLNVKYVTKKGAEIESNVSVGAIVYSEERAKLYLLVWTMERSQFSIINAESIVAMQETNEKNEHYMSKKIREILDEMFVVSIEEPVEVVVEVSNKFNIKEKFERLCKLRKFGKMEMVETPEKFLYKDKIRGLDDFARYIRGFGRACKVLTPDILIDKMVDSNDEIICMYEQYFESIEV